MAPCAHKISREAYREIVDNVLEFLAGDYRKLEQQLKVDMQEASARLDYEKAAAYRDKLRILERIKQKQKAGFPDLNDRDIFAAVLGEKYGKTRIAAPLCAEQGRGIADWSLAGFGRAG